MSLMHIRAGHRLAYKFVNMITIFAFMASLCVLPGQAYGQGMPNLPAPGTMVRISPTYTPAMTAGIIINPENPLQLGFIIDSGDDNLQGEDLRAESTKLINYFLATLAVPEDEMWVNLSPYEKDRIIADGLSVTEMGRDMLVQDYMLKQVTASLIYPEEELGDKFWKKIHQKAQARFGNIEIPTNTFNKVWIVPDKAAVYVNGASVFVNESHLKVMLEEDYLALESNAHSDNHGAVGAGLKPARTEDSSGTMSQEVKEIMREVILPELEREVNEGKNFANLRQIYNAMILATWYKKNLKESFLGEAYMDSNKVDGIDLADRNAKEQIYNQYLNAVKKGVYDYIKEDYDPATQEIIPKKYFSGGLLGTNQASLEDQASLSVDRRRRLTDAQPEHIVATDLAMFNGDGERLGEDLAMLTRRSFIERLAAVAAGTAVFGVGAMAQDQSDRIASLREIQQKRFDDGSGFIVGGLNSPQAMIGLNGINNIPLPDIERNLRNMSMIQRLDGNLKNQLIGFNQYVLNNGLTHQKLAAPLFDAIAAHMEGRREFNFNGRTFKVDLPAAGQSRGSEFDLFGASGLVINYASYVITSDTGEVLEFSEGNAVYINHYGYYGRPASAPRQLLSPERLREFFFSPVEYNEGNAADRPVTMDHRRQMTRLEIEQRIGELMAEQAAPGIAFYDSLGDGQLGMQIRGFNNTTIFILQAG